MTKFQKGDIVICKKCTVGQKMVFDGNGFRYENYIDTTYFNREAVIDETWKECALRNGLGDHEDKEEYSLKFLDNENCAAWFTDNDLILKYPHYFSFEYRPEAKFSVS